MSKITPLALLPLLLVAGCALQPDLALSSLSSASTTCVSDPIVTSGDDDFVAQCPPPDSTQLANATLNYAQQYAADNNLPDPTYDVSGGCGPNSQGGITCVVLIRFGGSQVIWVACNSPDNANPVATCVSHQQG